MSAQAMLKPIDVRSQKQTLEGTNNGSVLPLSLQTSQHYVADDTPLEFTLTVAEVRALLCPRAVCSEHILERVYAERKLRRGLEA